MIEFFTREFREPDASMLELMDALGGQVGEFIERQRGAEALRESEARKGAMLESALDGVITIDHEGRVVEFNPAAEHIFGYTSDEALETELAELIVPPALRERHREALRRTVETGESSILGQRLELTGMRADAEEFPVELAISRIGGHDPPMFTAYLRDITERKRAEEERERLLELERIARVDADQARDQLAAILSGVADGVVAQAPDGELIFANEAAAAMYDFDAPADLIEASFDEVMARVQIIDEPDETVRFRKRATGAETWVLMKSTPILDDRDDVTMDINVIEDVTELKRRERVQRLLAETGRVIGSLLDPDEILQRVAEVLVPELADWCGVHVTPDPGAAITPATMVLQEADKEEAVRRELSRYPADRDHPAGLANVIRSGEAELIRDVGEADLRAMAQDEAHLELIRAERIRSRMLVPLSSHDRTFGAISLATSGSGRVLDADDLRLAEEIGRRTGAGSTPHGSTPSARRSPPRSRRACCRPSCPRSPGCRPPPASGPPDRWAWSAATSTTCSRPAGGAGRWPSATSAARARRGRGDRARPLHPARGRDARGRPEQQPGDAERGAPAPALRPPVRHGGLRHVEPRARGVRITLASAGHPLPLLLRSDGSVEWLGADGTLLGVVSDPELVDAGAELAPGDAVVFYTDGVSEARGANGSLDEAGLASLVGGCAGLDADAIASRIESAALEIQDGRPRDDIAVVVLQAGDAPARTG